MNTAIKTLTDVDMKIKLAGNLLHDWTGIGNGNHPTGI